MKKGIILISLLLATITTNAQYVTVDPDGYTNVREQPNARSTILGTVDKYQTFYTPDQSCYAEEDFTPENENWMPIVISEEPIFEVGYIYRKHVKNMDEYPRLELIVQKDSLNAYFEDKDVKVSFSFDENSTKEIKVSYKSKESNISEEDAKVFFLDNPLPQLRHLSNRDLYSKIDMYKGHEEIYYLTLWGGDGGDMYSAKWVLDKGILVDHDLSIGTCSLPYLKLDNAELTNN